MKRVLLLLIVPLCFLVPAAAKEGGSLSDAPELEKRMMALSRQLRCLVCQNETLADSQADLALDLRKQILEQMKAGRSDKEVIVFLTDRYGDFVLYRPPLEPRTYLLWFGPFLFLGGGLFALYRLVKRLPALIEERPLAPGERKRARQLLSGNESRTP